MHNLQGALLCGVSVDVLMASQKASQLNYIAPLRGHLCCIQLNTTRADEIRWHHDLCLASVHDLAACNHSICKRGLAPLLHTLHLWLVMRQGLPDC